MADINGMFLNSLFSLLLKKIIVPTDYHNRVAAIKTMLEDDVSGLVDSLTDFSVQTASVDFSVETDNPELTRILKKWLDNINSPYKGQIPRGIKPLAEEYFKERWKSSSFPILKIAKWDTINGISVPTKMFFVDGGSVHAKDLKPDEKNKELIAYKYYLGNDKTDLLDKGVIITKPYGRWFDEYPNPFLIKRGVYHNWSIIQSIKNRETEILDQIIPYLFLVKKGSDALVREGVRYSNTQLKEIVKEFQALMDDMKATSSSSADKNVKSPIRVTQFDEEIKHLIPDMKAIFDPQLFATAERNILAGLGFVDVVEAVSTSRRESILNPKAFIEETKKGVEDFKGILKELVAQIIEQNKDTHKKYMSDNVTYNITSSPVKGFMTNDFKNQLRLLWERGQLSNQTYAELVGEIEFATEVRRREKEAKDGLEYTMYPHIRENREGVGIDIVGEEPVEKDKDTDKNGKPIPQDKLTDKDKYDIGKNKDLETAPYKTIKDLPSRVKNNLDADLQSVFMRVFNNAYSLYKNETRAFRVAWSVIKRIGRKNKKGFWVRKKKRVEGKLQQIPIDDIIRKVLNEAKKSDVEDTINKKELEIAEKKSKLLDQLLKNRKEK